MLQGVLTLVYKGFPQQLADLKVGRGAGPGRGRKGKTRGRGCVHTRARAPAQPRARTLQSPPHTHPGCRQASLPDYYSGLPPENPGSRWPKTTLGCLRDGARLAPDQLAALNRICL